MTAIKTTNESLARQVRAWRGDVPRWKAAEQLGMPAKTLEGIEYGKGFRYPTLLLNFIWTVDIQPLEKTK